MTSPHYVSSPHDACRHQARKVHQAPFCHTEGEEVQRREKQHNSEGSKTAQAIPGPMLSSAVLQAQLRLVIPHLHDCPSKIQHNAPIQQLALSEALGLPHNWAW